MQGSTDEESAQSLATQLKDLLKERTLTFDQLASFYNIKMGQSVTQRLKEVARDGEAMTLGDFLARMPDYFDLPEGPKPQVRVRKDDPSIGYPATSSGKGGNGAGARSRVPAVTSEICGAAEPSTAGLVAVVASANGPQGAGCCAGAAAAATPEDTRHAAGCGEDERSMKYADVSRGIQGILREHDEPISVERVEELFGQKFGVTIFDIVGMPTGEYLQRKEKVFDYSPAWGTVFLQAPVAVGPPVADPADVRDEAFVVREFEALVEALGPIVYISTLCGKFIQRNGVSVTSVAGFRPLDIFKRHPDRFIVVGAGNVTLKKNEQLPEVQRMVGKPSSKTVRMLKATEEALLPVPDVIGERDVVNEFRRLILADQTDAVYISSLCGRFLQRFKKPVTSVINCKPAEFLRRYPDIFVMTGAGNVGLREVLGHDVESVPPPPQRVRKATRGLGGLATEVSSQHLEQVVLTDAVYRDVYASLTQEACYQDLVRRLQAMCELIEQDSFLATREIVLGGAASAGVLASGHVAEIVLFVRQLPHRNFGQWLPHILDTLAPVLESQLAPHGAEMFRAERDCIHFQFSDVDGRGAAVRVYVSPAFRDGAELWECLRATPQAERSYLYPAMVKERCDFVNQHSRDVKALISLVAWWASKQRWSSALAVPSDWLLGIVVVHAIARSKMGDAFRFSKKANECDDADAGVGLDLAVGMAMVLEHVAAMSTARVIWADMDVAAYREQDISRQLLDHEPLFMDPLNPFSNLVDSYCFDFRELVAAAGHVDCLRCFKVLAAQLAAAVEPQERATSPAAMEGDESEERD